MDNTEHLLNLFPKEIWNKIIDYITEPNDQENVYHAAPLFRDILLPKRVLFMFPKVWKLAKRYCHPLHCDDDDPYGFRGRFYERSSICVSCGNINPGNWYTEILKLRLVCKAWSQAIDRFCQNLPESYKVKQDPNRDKTCISHLAQDNFNIIRSPSLFLSHFEPLHFTSRRSPFLGNSVYLEFGTNPDEARLLLNDMHQILNIWGHHIWHCGLEIVDQFPTRFECYTVIRLLLELMPNLITLDIKYMKRRREEEDVVYRGQQIDLLDSSRFWTEFHAFQVSVNSHFMPTLGKLKVLKLSHLPIYIFNGIIQSNGHVELLEIRRKPHQDCSAVIETSMPYLKHFSMKFYEETQFAEMAELESSWPLTKLVLDFRQTVILDWNNVLNVLHEKFGDTLITLTVYLPKKVAFDEKTINRKITWLPHLTQLRLIMNANYISMDFVIPLQSLEILEVLDWTDTRKKYMATLTRKAERGKAIKFLGFYEMKSHTNIWEYFSNLKHIRFDILRKIYSNHYPYISLRPVMIKTCTRNEWLQKRQGLKKRNISILGNCLYLRR